MIEHIVLFRFKPDTSAATKETIARELLGLKRHIKDILDLTVGSNFSDRNKGYEYGLVVRFADRQGLDRYQVHPEHQRVVQEFVRPALADIIAVDYEIPG